MCSKLFKFRIQYRSDRFNVFHCGLAGVCGRYRAIGSPRTMAMVSAQESAGAIVGQMDAGVGPCGLRLCQGNAA